MCGGVARVWWFVTCNVWLCVVVRVFGLLPLLRFQSVVNMGFAEFAEQIQNVCDGAFGDLRDLNTTMSGANLYARGRSCEATTSKKLSCKK